MEVAAFEAFARMLTDPTLAGRYDHVLFDTAPTGHTLRLLSLPAAWAGYLAVHPEAAHPLGPLTGISGQRSTFEHAVDALRDPGVTTMVVVAQPDTASLSEAARTVEELRALRMPAHHLVVNGVLTQPLRADATARAYADRQHAALARLPHVLRSLDASQVPLVATDLVGLEALRSLTAPSQPGAPSGTAPVPDHAPATATEDFGNLPELPGIDDLIDDLAVTPHGVVVVTGKGGVGKTAIAARLGRDRLVVLDTAASGHTLLLLDVTGAFHRQTLGTIDTAGTITTPLMRLQANDLATRTWISPWDPTST